VGDVFDRVMSFEAEMIIPYEGWDDLGQKATATFTFLQYSISIAHRDDDNSLRSFGSLKLMKEELVRITQTDAPSRLLFAKDFCASKSPKTVFTPSASQP
jgi:hypothetical protein